MTQTRFTNYLQLTMAMTFKAVLAMVNDHSWQNSSQRNNDACIQLHSMEAGQTIVGISRLRLIYEVSQFLTPSDAR